MKKITTGAFIEKAISIHGYRYHYSKVDYKRNSIKVCITCPKHGDFWQTPMTHIRGISCPVCGIERREEKRHIKLRKWAIGTEYEGRRDVIIMPNKKISLISEEDYDMLSGFYWHSSPSSGGGYYAKACIDHNQVLMHRLILGVNDPGIEVDHKDGIKFNNRRDNLRICDRNQNMCNIPNRNKYGFKGVGKSGDRYKSTIRKNNKTYHLGCFSTPEEAAVAYDNKAKEIHGEFAVLNFK